MYSTGSEGHSSSMFISGQSARLEITGIDASYKQTTYAVKLNTTTSNSFTLTDGHYSRTSMSQYSDGYFIHVWYLYGWK